MQPPFNIELEQQVLGALLIDAERIGSEVFSTIKKMPIFYKNAHNMIYFSLLSLYEESKSIDLLTASQRLKEKGNLEAVGGNFYLIELTQKIINSAHTEFHTRILQQLYIKRTAGQLFQKVAQKSYDEQTDIFDILSESYKELDTISEWLNVKQSKEFSQLVADFFKKANEPMGGVPIPIEKMQRKLNGYQKSDLIILAGRPAMGKTAYLLNEVLYQAYNGYAVGVFSLEMSARQCVARLFSNYAQINANRLALGTFTNEEAVILEQCRAQFSKLPIYIEEEPAISLLSLKIKAKKMVREKGVKIIYIDYLQLMTASEKTGQNREQEISEISRGLKGLAKELDIPIVALSQLSRNVELQSGHKRPQLSHLRESGAIEQDADIVLFLYRPEYYGIDQWDMYDNAPTQNTLEVIISKFRNGRTGNTLVGCNLEKMQFFNV